MEDVGQSYGYILYRTKLQDAASGELALDQLHSYAIVYIDGKQTGTLDRRLKQDHLTLKAPAGARLDILVENTSRVNFGKFINAERAGITKQVTLSGKPLTGWEIYPLPMGGTTAPVKLRYSTKDCTGPCFYRASFTLSATGDTFLDTSAFTKGQLWLNNHALGRIWNAGPQMTLYAPAPWLTRGTNEVVVFDLEGKSGSTLRGLATPQLDGHPVQSMYLEIQRKSPHPGAS